MSDGYVHRRVACPTCGGTLNGSVHCTGTVGLDCYALFTGIVKCDRCGEKYEVLNEYAPTGVWTLDKVVSE